MTRQTNSCRHPWRPKGLALTFPAWTLILVLGVGQPVSATPGPGSGKGPQLSAPVTPVIFDGDLRDLPGVPAWKPGDPIKLVPRRRYQRPGVDPLAPPRAPQRDPLLEQQLQAPDNTSALFTTPLQSFPGIPFLGLSPPDTVGDVGPDHYIQMINGGSATAFQVFDKTGGPLTAVLNLDSLWTAGGSCRSGFGDPIVLYDRLADRWLMAEFPSSGNSLCIYISQTPDPVSGGWYGYEIDTPNFPDYPKFAVWPDAYLLTSNERGDPPLYALDRAQMLAGLPTTTQRFTVNSLGGFGFQALTPADLDGPTPPPPGSPAYFMRHRDDEAHGGAGAGDWLDLFALIIDWVTPSNSSLTQLPGIATAEFDSDLCGLSTFDCIPQPGTGQGLDPLREVVMFRLQYRNQGSHELLVGNFVTDVGDFNDHAGIRWFELRKAGAGDWSLHQEGTYAPDATHRWMGGISADQAGNIAVGYNVSDSSSVHPGLRYTGRLETDPLGVMTQLEATLVAGGGSQNGGPRWGDYAAMSVDPADDCTFWFTGEYQPGGNWATWIGAFAFDACGCLAPPAPPVGVAAATPADNQIEVSWQDSTDPAILEYFIGRSDTPGGPYARVQTVADSSPGVGGGAPYAWVDQPVSGGTSFYYSVSANTGDGCVSLPSAEASATATGDCTLAPDFAGLETVSSPPDCTIVLGWSDANSNCAAAVSYDIYRSTTPGFTPDGSNRIATGYTLTDYTDSAGLTGGTSYYYVVRAVDAASGQDDGNTAERSAVPGGLPVGPDLHVSSDVPRNIPDNDPTGVSSVVTVSDLGPVAELVVHVELTHTYVGDLTLVLESPGGSQVVLLERPADGGNPGSCGDQDMLVSFFDAGGYDLWNHCQGTTPWYSGDAMPAEPLATLQGAQVQGDWKLIVSDNAGFDEGRVESWSLELTRGGDCQVSSAVPKEVSPANQTKVVKGAGTALIAYYEPACGALDNTIYMGSSSTMLSGMQWWLAFCNLGTTSPAIFDPGTPPGGSFFYFVPVANDGSVEGSYGMGSLGERPEATWLTGCNYPQQLIGPCP